MRLISPNLCVGTAAGLRPATMVHIKRTLAGCLLLGLVVASYAADDDWRITANSKEEAAAKASNLDNYNLDDDNDQGTCVWITIHNMLVVFLC